MMWIPENSLELKAPNLWWFCLHIFTTLFLTWLLFSGHLLAYPSCIHGYTQGTQAKCSQNTQGNLPLSTQTSNNTISEICSYHPRDSWLNSKGSLETHKVFLREMPKPPLKTYFLIEGEPLRGTWMKKPPLSHVLLFWSVLGVLMRGKGSAGNT